LPSNGANDGLPAIIGEAGDPKADRPLKILDIAAHGLYGLAFAKNNPQASMFARLAKRARSCKRECAQHRVADRYATIGEALSTLTKHRITI